jgi:Na+/H+ antiporter NhaD/arsenite permease-like protein
MGTPLAEGRHVEWAAVVAADGVGAPHLLALLIFIFINIFAVFTDIDGTAIITTDPIIILLAREQKHRPAEITAKKPRRYEIIYIQ